VKPKTPASGPFPITTHPELDTVELDTAELEAAAVLALPELTAPAVELPPVETAPLETEPVATVGVVDELTLEVADTLVVCDAKVGVPERSQISSHTFRTYSKTQ
jgi:hypothetical protein